MDKPVDWRNRCLMCGWTPADDDHECITTAEPLGIGPGGHSWDDIGRGLEDLSYVDDSLDQIRAALGDLPGITISYSPPHIGDLGAVRVVQDFGKSSPEDRRQFAAHLAVPSYVIEDCAPAVIAAMVDSQLNQAFRPWRYPDPCPMPRLVLFPRLARWARWLR